MLIAKYSGMFVLSIPPLDTTNVMFNKSLWTIKSPSTLTADLQSKLSDDFVSFTHYFLDLLSLMQGESCLNFNASCIQLWPLIHSLNLMVLSTIREMT